MSPNRSLSRRRVLSLAGSATLAGALSGCTATLPPLGQRVRYGRVDVPAAGEPPYTDWLPQPSALQDDDPDDHDDTDHLPFTYTTPDANGWDTIGRSVGFGGSAIRVSLDYMGFPFGELEWALGINDGGTVLYGDIDRSNVGETLTETVYDPVGQHRAFDLYRRRDESTVVAVSGTHVVATSGAHAAANARAIVDAGTGNAPRYSAANDDAATLLDAIGDRPFVWTNAPIMIDPGYTGGDPASDTKPDVEPIDGAFAQDFDESAVYNLMYALFDPADVPSKAAVQDLLEQMDYVREATSVEVEVGDRLVTVEQRYPLDEIDTEKPQPQPVPVVTWRTEVDRSAGTLTIEHVAGETIDADRLELDIDGGTDRNLGDRMEQVAPGDTITVDLAEVGETVRLVYVRYGNSKTVIHSVEPSAAGDAPTTTETSND